MTLRTIQAKAADKRSSEIDSIVKQDTTLKSLKAIAQDYGMSYYRKLISCVSVDCARKMIINALHHNVFYHYYVNKFCFSVSSIIVHAQ